MDEVLGLRFNALDLGRFSGIDLARYNVLIFPPAFGGAAGYTGVIGKEGTERLTRWVEAGGTAIGIGSGTEFLASKGLDLTRTRLRREAPRKVPAGRAGAERRARRARGTVSRRGGSRARAAARRGEGRGQEEAGTGGREERARVALRRGAAPRCGCCALRRGHEQGSVADRPPVDLARWVKPLLPPRAGSGQARGSERADERLREFLAAGGVPAGRDRPRCLARLGSAGRASGPGAGRRHARRRATGPGGRALRRSRAPAPRWTAVARGRRAGSRAPRTPRARGAAAGRSFCSSRSRSSAAGPSARAGCSSTRYSTDRGSARAGPTPGRSRRRRTVMDWGMKNRLSRILSPSRGGP